MDSTKCFWQQGCYWCKKQQSLKHVFWVLCGEWLVCKKSDAGSCHFPAINISLCSECICQIPDSESESDKRLCLRHHCSPASDSHIFSLCSCSTLSHYCSICQELYVIGLIRNWPITSVCLGWGDPIMEKKTTFKTSCLAPLLSCSLILPYNFPVVSLQSPSVIRQKVLNTFTN